MSQSTRRPQSVNAPDPSHNGPPSDGEAREPDGPAGTGFDPAAPEAPAPTPQDTGPDPFDPARLRLTQDPSAALGVKKALLSVPVRKPDKVWFVRVHSDESYRLDTAVIELRGDREIYLVDPAVRPALATEATLSPRTLFTAVNRQGIPFLWPIRLPRADGRADEWARTEREAAERATRRWVRVTANMDLGAYDVYEAPGQLSEPEWPALPLRDLLKIAFKDRLIDTLDHPILRRLRGEA
jgi:hypothetical protein